MKKTFTDRLPMPRLGIPLILTLLLSLAPLLGRAQMFSHDNSSGTRAGIPGFAVYGGLEWMDFNYQGSDAGTSQSGVYAFNGAIMRLAVEGPGIDFFLGSGGDFTGLSDVSYFDAGIRAGYGLPITRTGGVFVLLPVQLSSTYTTVTNDQIVISEAPEFQQATLGIGAGAEVHVRVGPQTRFKLNVMPGYSYSFSFREQDADGTLFNVHGGVRLYFDYIFGSAGLSIGYDYSLRDYDIEGQLLDYKGNGHRFLIGITF